MGCRTPCAGPARSRRGPGGATAPAEMRELTPRQREDSPTFSRRDGRTPTTDCGFWSPRPTRSGRRRTAAGSACRAWRPGLAAAGAEVTLLAPWHPARGSAVRRRRGAAPPRLAANALPALVPERLASPQALLSLQPTAWGPRRLLRKLGSFDAVQFDFCAQAPWMDLLPRGRRRLLGAQRRGRLRRLQRRPRRWRSWRAGGSSCLERRRRERADLVLTSPQADARRLARALPRRGGTWSQRAPGGGRRRQPGRGPAPAAAEAGRAGGAVRGRRLRAQPRGRPLPGARGRAADGGGHAAAAGRPLQPRGRRRDLGARDQAGLGRRPSRPARRRGPGRQPGRRAPRGRA